MYLSKNLRHLRKLKDMTIDDVANTLGISNSGYSSYETGRNQPQVEKLIALSELFEISVDDLLVNDLTKNPAIRGGSKDQEVGTLGSTLSRLTSDLTETEKRVLKLLTPDGRVELEYYIQSLIERYPEDAERLGLIN